MSWAFLACATDETKLLLSLSTKHHRKPCSRPPLAHQDLSKSHDWSVKKACVDLLIRMKGNSKRTSSNLFNPLGAWNKDLGTASQTLLQPRANRRDIEAIENVFRVCIA